METTEIEIAENNGELVQLDAGKTIVNLVLKKVLIEGLSTTNTSFVTNMQRVVSDKTHEYPDNENHTFKVRLPAPLHLSGHGWEVALIRLFCLRLVIDIMLY